MPKGLIAGRPLLFRGDGRGFGCEGDKGDDEKSTRESPAGVGWRVVTLVEVTAAAAAGRLNPVFSSRDRSPTTAETTPPPPPPLLPPRGLGESTTTFAVAPLVNHRPPRLPHSAIETAERARPRGAATAAADSSATATPTPRRRRRSTSWPGKKGSGGGGGGQAGQLSEGGRGLDHHTQPGPTIRQGEGGGGGETAAAAADTKEIDNDGSTPSAAAAAAAPLRPLPLQAPPVPVPVTREQPPGLRLFLPPLPPQPRKPPGKPAMVLRPLALVRRVSWRIQRRWRRST